MHKELKVAFQELRATWASYLVSKASFGKPKRSQDRFLKSRATKSTFRDVPPIGLTVSPLFGLWKSKENFRRFEKFNKNIIFKNPQVFLAMF